MASKQPQMYQPTKKDQEEFAFFWQHLRRNEIYHQYYQTAWNSESITREARQFFGVPMPDAKKYEQLEKDLDTSRNVGGLGVPIDPSIEDSEEAVRQVLRKYPDYFQNHLWPQARLKTSVACWNRFGARGCMWSGGTTAFRDFHGHVALFWRLTEELDDAEKNKDSGATAMKKYEDCRAEMKRFLASSPRMDFVIDASLTVATILQHLKERLEEIKDLRKRVGLERNVDPPRLRDWKKHLKIWDKVPKPAHGRQPKFDRRLLRKLFPSVVNKLGSDVGLRRITPTQYKLRMDALRLRAREAFRAAKKRIEMTFP